MKEEDWTELAKFCQLDEYQLHTLKKILVSANTVKLGIRQVLPDEGKAAKRGYYLMEGTVHLTATLSNGQRVVLTQLGRGALLNLEAAILGRNPYAIVAGSSSVVCLVIEEREALALASGIKQ
jgi:CRP-like cAMP-binding protein